MVCHGLSFPSLLNPPICLLKNCKEQALKAGSDTQLHLAHTNTPLQSVQQKPHPPGQLWQSQAEPGPRHQDPPSLYAQIPPVDDLQKKKCYWMPLLTEATKMILIALSISNFCTNILGLLLQFVMIFLSFTIRISFQTLNIG